MAEQQVKEQAQNEKSIQPKKLVLSQAQSQDLPSYLIGPHTVTFQSSSGKIDRGKRCNPEMKYGLSYEAPSYFMGEKSMICKDSYNNPFIPGNDEKQTREKFKNWQIPKLNGKQTFNIHDHNKAKNEDFFIQKHFHQASYNHINHQEIKKSETDVRTIEKNKAHELFLSHSNTKEGFKRKKNYFGDFSDNNDSLNVYGSLQARDRPKKLRVIKDYSLNPIEQERLEMAKKTGTLAHQNHLSMSRSNSQAMILNSLDKDSTKYLNITENQSKGDNNNDMEYMIDKSLVNNGLNTTKQSSKPKNLLQFPLLDQRGGNISNIQEMKYLPLPDQASICLNNTMSSKISQIQINRQKSIDKIIPIKPMKRENSLYLKSDTKYQNTIANEIIRRKMHEQLSEKIYKKKLSYGTERYYDDFIEQEDYISQFEKLQYNLFRQKKAQKKAFQKREQILDVEPDYNAGKTWFQNYSSLQGNRKESQ